MARCTFEELSLIVVDTGGIDVRRRVAIEVEMADQSLRAIASKPEW